MIDERDSRIHISQLELMAFIGVPDQERAQPQRLTISLTLWANAEWQGVERRH